MSNKASPYQSLPRESYWRVASAAWTKGRFTNLYKPKFPIGLETPIASAGSCFAQHIGRHLKERGFNYVDAEPAPLELPETSHAASGYGLFSARYGNVYSTRQFLELLSDAFRLRVHDEVWEKDGRYFDPFRPTIEPNGFSSPEEVKVLRLSHLRAVRRLLKKTEVFVFTLGLTESWINAETGYTYQICPGTTAGSFDPDLHKYVNLGFAEVYADLKRIVTHLAKRNAKMKVLLTVSPVPLVATASGKHVVSATGYSKSVLRAAAGQIADEFDHVDYFPSYEIITSHLSLGAAFGPDLREVREEAVSEVMDCFFSAHGHAQKADASGGVIDRQRLADQAAFQEAIEAVTVVCDEIALDSESAT